MKLTPERALCQAQSITRHKNGAAGMVSSVWTAKWPSEEFGIDVPKKSYHRRQKKSSKSTHVLRYLADFIIIFIENAVSFFTILHHVHICPRTGKL